MNTKTLHWLKSVDSLFRSPDHKVTRWFSAFVLLLLWLSIEGFFALRSEEHTSELQSLRHLVCRLLLEKQALGPRPGGGIRLGRRRPARAGRSGGVPGRAVHRLFFFNDGPPPDFSILPPPAPLRP